MPETQIPPGGRKLLQPGRDVHAFAIAVVAVDDHLADVDADADVEPFLLGYGGVALCHSALEGDGAFDGIDHAAELGEEAIAHELEDPPVMPRDLGLE